MKKILFLALFVAVAQVALPIAYSVETMPDTKTACQDCYVTNPDGILSERCVDALNELLTQLEKETTVEVAVVSVDSIDSYDVEGFATKLFNHRGIGKAGNNNGLLILHVKSERYVKIETGLGLEGVLPDAACSQILDNYVYPAFRADNFDKGIYDAAYAIYEKLRSDEARLEVFYQEMEEKTDSIRSFCNYIIASCCVLLLLLIIVYFYTKKLAGERNVRYEALSTMLFWCFFLGIIFWPVLMLAFAIKNFRKKIRTGEFLCPKCGTPMKRLSETDEDVHLIKSQQKEEKVKSVDYDVWLCDHCQNKEVISYNNKMTSYKTCPHCNAITYKLVKTETLVAATTSSSGMGMKTYCCANCNHSEQKKYTIPKIVVSSSSGGGYGGRSGGYSGGGGGSWGGGRSGGGGAGGRY